MNNLLNIAHLLVGAALIAPQAIASADISSASVDRLPQGQQRYDSAVFNLLVGAGSSLSLVFIVEESDDGSTWTQATDNDGANITTTVETASSLTELEVDLRGLKKYVRVTYDHSESTGSTSIACAGVFGSAALLPA